jgi:hypothetical protein
MYNVINMYQVGSVFFGAEFTLEAFKLDREGNKDIITLFV